MKAGDLLLSAFVATGLASCAAHNTASVSAPQPVAAAAASAGDLITRPRFTQTVAPVLPERAREAGISGTVLVRCIATTEGTLRECQILQGVPFLDEAVLAVLPQWRLSPALFRGQPINVGYQMRFQVKRQDLARRSAAWAWPPLPDALPSRPRRGRS